VKLDVIIPIGPGHEDLVNEAVNSVNMACLTDQGPFTEIKIKAVDDRDGSNGRSKSRNLAMDASKADWLFFLDADDLMHPDALGILRDYEDFDAVWGLIAEYKDGLVLPRFQVPYIEKFETLVKLDPYYTLQMGFFVRREVMPKFDEYMDCGEDWKAYIHLWKNYQCIKQDRPLMVNRRGSHSTGPRSATGRDWMEAVHEMISLERSKINNP
jgi:glycosyltransferase involved in cell wall biosynthesis